MPITPLLLWLCGFAASLFFLYDASLSPPQAGALLAAATGIFFYCIGTKRLLSRLIALTIGLCVGAVIANALRHVLLLLHANEILHSILIPTALALGIATALKAANEEMLLFSFGRLSSKQEAKKEREKTLVADAFALMDPRTIDLAASGLIDHRLLIPLFVVNHLKLDSAENPQAKQAIGFIKKLEELPELKVQYTDTDFSEESDLQIKMARLCHELHAHWLTSGKSRLRSAESTGIRIVDIDALSKALKPLREEGETLQIKIQRPGKEAGQGVGYLDDGTMVVVNGGGEYIGSTITAEVLSTKHTMAGRIIFCNVHENSHVGASL